MTTSTLTLTEFLLARIAEKEANAINYLRFEVRDGRPGNYAIPDEIRADCEAKRRIVELHESWPVLVETPIEVDLVTPDDPTTFAFRASKRLAWLTEQEYRQRFGDEPPTAPMLRALAAVYADHPDYREEWRP